MSKNLVTYTPKGPLGLVWLNHAIHGNLVTPELASDLREICHHINQDPGIRVVILSGSGSKFSTGREVFDTNSNLSIDQWLRLHQVTMSISGLKVPTIAAINGDALDHGLELCLACDLRVVSEDATLGFTDLRNGTIPWDGGTQRLPRVVGKSMAMQLLLTSELVNGRRAHDIGLANIVTTTNEVFTTAQHLGYQIATSAPIASQFTKLAIHKGMDLTLTQGIAFEADLSFLLQTTTDRCEGIKSFLEKRNPKFTGR